MSTVIIGSFRKHLDEIKKLKLELEKYGILVLSPINDTVVNPRDEFVVFRTDPVSDPRLLQNGVFSKIQRCSFIVVANFGGYLGRATILEIGYAIAHNIDIFTLEKIDEPHIGPFCRLLKEIFPDISRLCCINHPSDDLCNK